jgi:hypothetical protein
VIKEMRLRGVKTIEEGNKFLEEYLPLYNKRFSVRPREKDDVHRALPRGMDLNAFLCIKTERTLRNDFTVAHNHKLYQIEDATRASKVIVQDRMDGSTRMTYQGRALRFKEITERPIRENKQPVATKRRKTYIPPADHPWRRFKIKNHPYDRERFLESQI